MLERYAAIFLTKILGGEDPNFLDIRSPSGAGIGQSPTTTTARCSRATRAACCTRRATTRSCSGDVGELTYDRDDGAPDGARAGAGARTSTASPTA